MTMDKQYSLVGNQLDIVSESMKKNLQKIEFKKQLAADIEIKKQYFRNYLKHNFALYPIPLNHQKLVKNIENNFDGQAKNALTERFHANIQKGEDLHLLFEDFLKHF